MTIDENDLSFDGDVALYKGRRFTGVVRAFYPNGALKTELHFCNGFEEGRCSEWYSNGQLEREWHAVRGVAEGRVAEWHENGQIKTVAVCFRGIRLLFDEWDDAGLHVAHRELDCNSELGKHANYLRSQSS